MSQYSINRVLNWLRVTLSTLSFSGRMFHVHEARTKNEFLKVVVLHLRGQKLITLGLTVDVVVQNGLIRDRKVFGNVVCTNGHYK